MGEESKVIFSLFGFLDVTGEVIGMWIILAVITLLCLIVKANLKERPGKFQNMVETGVEYLDNFFGDALGKEKSRKYFCFLSSLFVFIIFSNYSGLIPGMGLTDYVKAPTSSFSVTIGLGIITFVFLQIAGIKAGVKHYFKRFVSPMFFMLPLLLLDEFIKPASLALRLFGNVFGEETVTEKLYEILPIGAPVVMMALSVLFCALQAIVFTMLVSIYLDEVTENDETEKIKTIKEK
ncbi:MAG: F0F1 ATP synthase subunit A [Clostridiales bacterium]|nr:F0F1 ATP synthase subunit A [Candidatus Equinaster intestinalis]